MQQNVDDHLKIKQVSDLIYIIKSVNIDFVLTDMLSAAILSEKDPLYPYKTYA